MQFFRLPKPIDIVEKVLPEPIADWVDTQSMQSIHITFVQKLPISILITEVIGLPKSFMPHWRSLRNFTHLALAI